MLVPRGDGGEGRTQRRMHNGWRKKEKRKESFTLPRISIKWKTKEFQKKKEKKIINSPLGIVKKAFCFTPNANSEGEKWE